MSRKFLSLNTFRDTGQPSKANLNIFKRYLKASVDTFFPRLCLCCNKKISDGYLCLNCQEKITFLQPPLCRYCSALVVIENGNICKKCFGKTYPYDRILSLTAYREPMPSLIHLFKYKNYDFIGEFLSSLMIRQLRKIRFNPFGYDFIIPVPMHKNKLKMRGYNQSEILAKLLSNYFKIPFKNDIIADIRTRTSQTKFSGTNRWQNVEGVFEVKKNIRRKRLILIDDIFTTGATVKSCCQELRKNGANTITVITLAKT